MQKPPPRPDTRTTGDSLIGSLRSPLPRERLDAAIELREIVEDVVSALWHSIKKPANVHHRGAEVRTLQLFNCSKHFRELLKLVLHGNYEVQCHALNILQEQSFRVTARQLRDARRAVRALRPRKSLPSKDLKLLQAELNAALDRMERMEHPPTVKS